MNKWNTMLVGTFLLALSSSCGESEVVEPEIALQAVTVENLHAPGDLVDRNTGDIIETRPFRYFSLEDNQIVTSQDGDWDIGFKGTTIIVNSGSSGPGGAQAAVVTGTFDEITSVPSAADFKSDGEDGMAIPSGSGSGWYNYNFTTHVISPIPGRIVLVRTTKGNYAKLEILSYYQDNPPLAEVDPRTTPSPYYTFRFLLQPNGSLDF
jgi:hypothetical protein